MIIEFNIHVINLADVNHAKSLLEEETKPYLFENGRYWFRAGKSLKLTGVLDCLENNENALFLLRALLKVTEKLEKSAIRVRDLTLDRDYLLDELDQQDDVSKGNLSCPERSSRNEVKIVKVALLYQGSFMVVSNLNELSAVKALRDSRNPISEYGVKSPSTVLMKQMNNVQQLIMHSSHKAELELPFRVAQTLHAFPEMVPRCVYALEEEQFVDDEQTKSILKDLSQSPNLTCSLRFTRLSFATLQRQNGRKLDKKRMGEAIALGLSRLIIENDEFETRFAKYWSIVLSKSAVPNSVPDEKAQVKGREVLFGTMTEDDHWVCPHNLRSFLHSTYDDNVSKSIESHGTDSDEWLEMPPSINEEENDDNDAEEMLKDFARDLALEADHQSSDGNRAVEMPATMRPILFSSREFFKILGMEEESNDRDEED